MFASLTQSTQIFAKKLIHILDNAKYMRRKILFISEHASPLAVPGGVDSGGQNVYVDNIAKELTQFGYEVDIYTRWDNPKLPKVVKYKKGVRVIHIEAGPKKYIEKDALLPHMNTFSDNMVKYILEENEQYELVHAHFFMSGLVAAHIKRVLGIPFVITFHALGKVRRNFQIKDKYLGARCSIEEYITQQADRIIALCLQDRDDLMRYYHANPSKISIVPCGFNPNKFYSIDKQLARRALKLDQHMKYILYVGRLVPRKGAATIIEALSILKDTMKCKLLIVGGESNKSDPSLTPEIGHLQDIAQKLGVTESVLFVGRKDRDELKYFYNAADVFVTTPWYEPFGMTVLEAMACGTPVIGSKVGGIKFTVLNTRTGFLVSPKNPQELAKKLTEILVNKNLSLLFSENAIQRAHTLFTWETVTSSLVKVYERIFSKYSKAIAIGEQTYLQPLVGVKNGQVSRSKDK